MRLLLVSLFFSFLYADIKNEVIKFYKKYYPNIEIVKIYSSPKLPKEYKKIDFSLANYKLPNITLKIDNRYYFIKIKAYLPVFKAIRTIKTNEYILPNVKKDKTHFKHFYSPPLTKIAPNLIASRIIAKNNIINKSNSTIRPNVLKGDSVSVVFKGDGIDIYSRGKAITSANNNETVKVKINNKIFEGIVKNGKVIIK